MSGPKTSRLEIERSARPSPTGCNTPPSRMVTGQEGRLRRWASERARNLVDFAETALKARKRRGGPRPAAFAAREI